MSRAFEAARIAPGQAVDFKRMFEALRDLKPKCLDCGVPLELSETGIRKRLNDQGQEEEICRTCFVSEVGERLLVDTPK